jgi:ubiquinone/menaquinone biosynthesis C-methylase UbiE
MASERYANKHTHEHADADAAARRRAAERPMSMQEVSEGNEFTAFWNNVLVAKFERFRNILLDGLSYHSEVPLRTLELARGAKVLDVGCGWGDTAIQLAKLTGPTGSVLGLDCCDAFLQKGRTDATAAGLSNVRFVVADVETYRFEPEYDLCFSRFGMMFFANPVAAMRNVRTALKPGGRLLFVTWRPISDNPWAEIPKKIVLEFLPPPGEQAQTCGPGPFSMASPDVVGAQLKAAGFVDARFERVDGDVMIGATVEQAMQFQLALGPAGEIFREGGALAEKRRPEIEAALRAELARHQRDGKVFMRSASWAIKARKPTA